LLERITELKPDNIMALKVFNQLAAFILRKNGLQAALPIICQAA